MLLPGSIFNVPGSVTSYTKCARHENFVYESFHFVYEMRPEMCLTHQKVKKGTGCATFVDFSNGFQRNDSETHGDINMRISLMY